MHLSFKTTTTVACISFKATLHYNTNTCYEEEIATQLSYNVTALHGQISGLTNWRLEFCTVTSLPAALPDLGKKKFHFMWDLKLSHS